MRFRFSVLHQNVIFVLRETREACGVGQRELSGDLKRTYNYANLVEVGQRMQNIVEFLVYLDGMGADWVQVVRRIRELYPPPPRKRTPKPGRARHRLATKTVRKKRSAPPSATKR